MLSTNTDDPASAVAGMGVPRTTSAPSESTIAVSTVTDAAASVALAISALTLTDADATSPDGVVMDVPQRGTRTGPVTSSQT